MSIDIISNQDVGGKTVPLDLDLLIPYPKYHNNIIITI